MPVAMFACDIRRGAHSLGQVGRHQAGAVSKRNDGWRGKSRALATSCKEQGRGGHLARTR